MELFNLPQATKVQKVIPKNAFEAYTTAKQKKLFSGLITRITWLNKLSPDTINLDAKEIKEIQVFKIELKEKENLQPLLDIIDKAIPYTIIFLIEHEDQIYLSTSIKHPHPTNENNSVIDWTFKTPWYPLAKNTYTFQLKKSLDAIYQDFCLQLLGKVELGKKSVPELIEFSREVEIKEKEIAKLKSSIATCKQFNQKVALNMRLRAAERELQAILSSK